MLRPTFAAVSLLAVGALAAHSPAGAQMPGMSKVAKVTASAKPAIVARGGKGVLTVTVAVAPQFHIYAHAPSDPDMIGTDFHATGAAFGPVHYPTAKTITVSKKPTRVYMGRSVITVPFTVPKTAKAGRMTIGGSLTYQGCNATMCYPPTTVPVKAVVTVK